MKPNEVNYRVSLETEVLIGLQADIARVKSKVFSALQDIIPDEIAEGENVSNLSNAFSDLQTAMADMTASSMLYSLKAISEDPEKEFFI